MYIQANQRARPFAKIKRFARHLSAAYKLTSFDFDWFGIARRTGGL